MARGRVMSQGSLPGSPFGWLLARFLRFGPKWVKDIIPQSRSIVNMARLRYFLGNSVPIWDNRYCGGLMDEGSTQPEPEHSAEGRD